MTYRDRREARAERLRGWADGREAKAEAAAEQSSAMAALIPFGQPILAGHYSQGRDTRYRARIGATMDRAVEHGRKAETMRSKADNIEAAAAGAIYSDDPDALAALAAKIERLEADRERYKAENVAYRKAHKAELAGMSAYDRGQAIPHPSYQLTNLGGNISRLRDRLVDVKRRQVRAAAADKAGGVAVARNGHHGYVSVTFTDKPDTETRDVLRAAGFAFDRGSWWGKGDQLPGGYTLPEIPPAVEVVEVVEVVEAESEAEPEAVEPVTFPVEVLALVGRPVAGLRAQVRRCHPDAPERGPMWRTLLSVELRQERAGGRQRPLEPWVYWTWEPESAGRDGYDCGFSGMTVELAQRQHPTIDLAELLEPAEPLTLFG